MTGERRYDDEEVRQIFEAAARPGETAASGAAADGMTLAELQDIGAEVGLSPARIAGAAVALESCGTAAPRRKQLGMPVAVGHTVELPRAPTEHEWDLLVSTLRETFGASGEISQNGGIREWSNGNLHAFVEPTETGYRLRLATMSGSGVAMSFGAVLFGSLTLALSVVLALSGQLSEDAPSGLIIFGVLATLAVVSNAIRLPAWASEREEQMRHIARRAVALLREPENPGP